MVRIVRIDDFVKQDVAIDGLENTIKNILENIQSGLFTKSEKLKLEKTKDTDNYSDFKKFIEEGNFVRSYFCEDKECENKIKEETKAVTRCLEFDQMNDDGVEGKCIYCGKRSKHK